MRRLLSLAVAVVLLVPLTAVSVAAAPGDAQLSVLHGIPGAVVDVYVDGVETIPDFEFTDLEGPLALPSGTYSVGVYADGEGPGDMAILSGDLTLPPGGNVTAVAHLDDAGGFVLSAFANDTSYTNVSQGRVVVRHLAKAPSVDVLAAGGVLFGGLENGDSGAADVAPLTYPVTINAAGTATQVFPASGAVDVAVPANTNVTVYAIGDIAGDFTVVPQVIDLGAPDGYGVVTVVHGVPGLTVDVYLNGLLTLAAFAPETITGQILLPAGTYDIAIYPAGADPLAVAPAIQADGVAVPAGVNASVVAHLDAGGMATATVFVDDVSSISTGDARVTVRHTAAAPAVDVLADGAVLFADVENGEGAGADVPEGSYAVTVNGEGTSTQVFPTAGAVDLALADGTNTVVYAIGTLGSDFTLIVDVVYGLGENGAFDDTASSVHKTNIGIIYRVGITVGTSPTTYSPEAPVTRGQMAAFLTRALGLPASSVDAFSDDDGSIFEADINAIAAFGITKAAVFDADRPVTRGEMAAFLKRALSLSGGGSTPFTDTGSSIFAGDIADIYAAGITVGTSPTTYSPDDPVTRAQMATFIARALGIGS